MNPRRSLLPAALTLLALTAAACGGPARVADAGAVQETGAAATQDSRPQEELPAAPMSVRSLLELSQPEPDALRSYGEGKLQFAQLWRPEGEGPHPVVLAVHGGCWRAAYDLEHLGRFCAALRDAGIACWSIEYRRVGDAGGGWPGTFADVAAAADHLREITKDESLDLDRVVAVGHSAGAQLALWLAARPRLPADEPLRGASPLKLRGVVSLAGIADLRRGLEEGVCGDTIRELLGGSPEQYPERYRLASPIDHLPLGVRQWQLAGTRDGIVPLPPQTDYAERAREAGDSVVQVPIEGAGHFELVVPGSIAWPAVLEAIQAALDPGPQDQDGA